MKTLLFIVSAVLIIFAVGLRLILVMGYSTYENLTSERKQLINHPHFFERNLSKIFYVAVDYRLLLGYVGVLGIIFSLLID